MIKKLIKNNTPFAIMKYYEILKFSDIKNSKYEVIYLDHNNDKVFKVLNNDDLSYFKSVKHKFDIVVSNDNGKVFEWLNFKSYVLKHPPKRKSRRKLKKKVTKKT